MNLQPDLHILPVRSRLPVRPVKDERPGGLNPRARAELRDVKRVLIVPFCRLCILLSYGTSIDNLDLQRRLARSRALVRGEVGIIGLEGDMQIAIRFLLARADLA